MGPKALYSLSLLFYAKNRLLILQLRSLMSLLRFTGAAISAAVAGAVLAACSSSGSQVTPTSPLSVRQGPSMASHMLRHVSPTGALELPPNSHPLPVFSSQSEVPAGTGKLYVSDYNANDVLIYNSYGQNQKPTGKITNGISGPLGTFVGPAGTLYVTNLGNSTVTVYPAGHLKPSETLTASEPISVVVDSQGTMYVSEYANSQVVEFDKGATSPTRTISISSPEGVWLDKFLNLYVSYNDASDNGHVMKFKHKSTSGTDLGISEGFAGDVKLDPQGNLLLGDQTNQVINIYARGTTSPARTISTSGYDAYKFSLNKADTRVYDAPGGTATVPVYSYTTGALVNTISSGLTSAYGVSNSPPSAFGTPF